MDVGIPAQEHLYFQQPKRLAELLANPLINRRYAINIPVLLVHYMWSKLQLHVGGVAGCDECCAKR